MAQKLGPLARSLSSSYYGDALPAHDRYHAERVRDLSIRLANDCKRPVDGDVLAAAAWLHDIGRPRERTDEIDDHDEWAAAEAAALLESEGVAADRIDAVTHCIRAHSIRASSPEPETLEARLLFDADKLDAAGARGIVRLACIVGERSGRRDEAYAVIDDASASGLAASGLPDVTLLREWADERLDALYTDPGRRLGESRRRFVDDFFARFENEIGVDGTQ
ncbi:metal-dependent phosphohydrolase [Natrinema saccharevitans]|uniref:Metal-dependent phosphohydrolase n=1 Tax=Natrinema saccharevitans TaxID=301967 RepID=A0A1S8AX00_9EURY|nr:HD domain-containing protein [Natrinema saccharevitans]OLZ41388.1 metal-dependent phosphohydrolase [Natrinema saccharevitans]